MIAQASNYSTTPVVNDTNPAAGLQHHPTKYKRVNIKHQTDNLRKKKNDTSIGAHYGRKWDHLPNEYRICTCIYLIM